jgi:hypothetical protein
MIRTRENLTVEHNYITQSGDHSLGHKNCRPISPNGDDDDLGSCHASTGKNLESLS